VAFRVYFQGALVIPAKAGIQTKRQWSVDKQPSVYILASNRKGTLYVGVTSNLVKRVWEHKNDMAEGFTKRYSVHRLVWYELHENMESAISREKRIKGWKEKWKLQRVERDNPNWQDLYDQIV
jgi:putative endonuclease